jgi:hypothetical protein
VFGRWSLVERERERERGCANIEPMLGAIDDSSNPSGFAAWLSAFYDNLLTVLQAEVCIGIWLTSVARCMCLTGLANAESMD